MCVCGWQCCLNAADLTFAPLYAGAVAFNQPLDAWDTGSVDSLYRMFYNASSFDQDLCPWGLKLPLINSVLRVNEMFVGTSCADTSNPNVGTFPKKNMCAICP